MRSVFAGGDTDFTALGRVSKPLSVTAFEATGCGARDRTASLPKPASFTTRPEEEGADTGVSLLKPVAVTIAAGDSARTCAVACRSKPPTTGVSGLRSGALALG